MELKLSEAEIFMGALAGVTRCIKGMRSLDDRYGVDRTWDIDIEGCLAEMALAKFLNLYWRGINKVKGTDVGEKTECRSTSYLNGRLILHEDDDDDTRYWLVTGVLGHYHIRGWILGCNGKAERFWQDPTGKNRWAFFVPQNELEVAS